MGQATLTFGLKFGDNIRKITFAPFDSNNINANTITTRIKNFNDSAADEEPYTSFKNSVCDTDGTPFDKIATFSIQDSTETELI